MADTPTYLQDASTLLTADGFATSNIWYHGTSSALVESIQENGLKRSGDRALKQAVKKTMATIGNSYSESIEPVFLTQSKQLAYYWAQQTVRERNLRFAGDEQPVVFSITLPEAQNAKVKPDVGAASLLLLHEGEAFMACLGKIYQELNLGTPDIDLRTAERMEYLKTLGMAYYDDDIPPDYLSLLTP